MRDMNAQRVIITMRDGTVFQGRTNIGSARRVSDFFRKAEGMFIILFDAVKGEGQEEKKVYFLNRNYILWVEPGEVEHELEMREELAMDGPE